MTRQNNSACFGQSLRLPPTPRPRGKILQLPPTPRRGRSTCFTCITLLQLRHFYRTVQRATGWRWPWFACRSHEPIRIVHFCPFFHDPPCSIRRLGTVLLFPVISCGSLRRRSGSAVDVDEDATFGWPLWTLLSLFKCARSSNNLPTTEICEPRRSNFPREQMGRLGLCAPHA